MTSSPHSLYALLLRMCDQYHQTCTKHAQNMHKTCTKHAQNMHKTCTKHAQNMHKTCTELAQNMHKTCTKHALLYYMKHHWLHNISAALKMMQSVVKRISYSQLSCIVCIRIQNAHSQCSHLHTGPVSRVPQDHVSIKRNGDQLTPCTRTCKGDRVVCETGSSCVNVCVCGCGCMCLSFSKNAS